MSTAGRPLTSSRSTAPSAQTSLAGVAGRPASRSGAQIPERADDPVRAGELTEVIVLDGDPKSANRTRRSSPSRTFDGVTSRWTIPASWAAASASPTAAAMASASGSGTDHRGRWPLPRSDPGRTRGPTPGPRSRTRSRTSMMFGWCRAGSAARLASSRSRATASASSYGWRRLTRDDLAGAESMARQTDAMPPMAWASSRRYRPPMRRSSISVRWHHGRAHGGAGRGGGAVSRTCQLRRLVNEPSHRTRSRPPCPRSPRASPSPRSGG